MGQVPEKHQQGLPKLKPKEAVLVKLAFLLVHFRHLAHVFHFDFISNYILAFYIVPPLFILQFTLILSLKLNYSCKKSVIYKRPIKIIPS